MVNKVKLTDRQADSIAHVLAALATFMEAHKAALFIDPKGSPYLELPGLDEPVQIVVESINKIILDKDNLEELAHDFEDIANLLRSKSAGLRYKVGDVVWAIIEDEDDYDAFSVSKVRIIQLDPDDKYLPYEYVFEDANDDDISNWLSEHDLFLTREAAFDAYRKRLRDRYSKNLARLDRLENEQ